MSLARLTSAPGLPAVIAHGGLGTIATIAAARRAGTHRRHYWSYRCTKPAKPSSRSSWQYSISYPALLRYTGQTARNGSSGSDSKTKRTSHHEEIAPEEQQKSQPERPAWEVQWDKEHQAFRQRMAKLAKSEMQTIERMETIQKMLREDPLQLFGIGARYAFNPFMNSKEWREKIFEPLWRQGNKPASQQSKPLNKTTNEVHETTNAAVKTESKTFETETSTVQEEVWIDPISMKKIVRVVERPISASEQKDRLPSSVPKDSTSVKIPVQKYMHRTTMTDLSKEEIEALSSSRKPRKVKLAGFASQPWLAKEGFGNSNPLEIVKGSKEAKNAPSPLPKATLETVEAPKTTVAQERQVNRAALEKIQSSIDRLRARKETEKAKEPAVGFNNFAENVQTPKVVSVAATHTTIKKSRSEPLEPDRRDEDIDLLRASDVRAASGRIKPKTPKLSEEEESARREKLTEDFMNSQEKLNKQLIEEFVRAVNSDNPQSASLLKIWTAYVQNIVNHYTTKDKRLDSLSIFTQDMISRLKLDTKTLGKIYGEVRMERGAGTSLGRYLNANRVSKAVDSLLATFENWNKEISLRLGQDTKESKALAEIFSKLRHDYQTYKNELRRQLLTKPNKIDKVKQAKQQAVDAALASEVETQKAAMLAYENRPRTQKEHAPPENALWEDHLKRVKEHERQHELRKIQNQKHRDKKLYYALRDIYESEYGTITTGHRQVEKKIPAVVKASAQPKQDIPTAEQDSPVVQEWPEGTVTKTESEPVKDAAVIQKQEQDIWRAAIEDLSSEIKRLTKQVTDMSLSESTGAKLAAPAASAEVLAEPEILAPEPVKTETKLYRVLAYDEYTGSVVVASAKSSLASETQRKTPAEIFMALERPQAFIEQMNELTTSGWELLDGGKKMLLFSKVAARTESHNGSASETITSSAQHDSGSTGEDATPPPPPPRNTAPGVEETTGPYSSYSGPTVRRQEPVFSGSSLPSGSAPSQQHVAASASSRSGSRAWQTSSQRKNRPERRRRRVWRFFAFLSKVIVTGFAGTFLVLFGVAAFRGERERRIKEEARKWEEWQAKIEDMKAEAGRKEVEKERRGSWW